VSEPLLADLRVLIVDDNPVNRRILMAQLSRWHTRPAAVSDGPSAIAALTEAAAENRAFVLVLLDANMPGMDGFDVAEQIATRPELAGATIMMLTSSGQYGDVGRCRALGIAAYLTKPVGADDLHAAIGRVLQGCPRITNAISTAATPSGEQPRALRLLLAEDNVVNQRVAVGMLSARGHSVMVANNGVEALAALARETFDLVLMDLQMPVMGGLEATEEIRRRECESGRHVRIVAMTAHAMRGDRDRCLAAGMDGYLSKPIDPLTLFAMVEHESSPAPAQPAPTAPDGPRKAVDLDAVMRRLGGDQDLFNEVAQLFLDDCVLRLEDIRSAVGAGDLGKVRFAAHALKGAAGSLSAAELVAAATALEACGADGRAHDAAAAVGQVVVEARRVIVFLRSALALERVACVS